MIHDVGAIVASSIATIILLHGAAQVFVPKTMLQMYQAPQGKLNTHLYSVMGTVSVSLGVAALCLLFSWTNFATSTGYALVPWVVVAAKNILSGKGNEVGYPLSNDVAPLLLGVFVCASSLAGLDFAENAAKFVGYFILLNGATLVITPDKHANAWGAELSVIKEKEPIVTMSLRALGLYLLSLGTFVTSAGIGYTATQAFGVAWVWATMMSLLPLFSKEMKGRFNVYHMVWYVPHIIVLGTTIFSAWHFR